MGTITGLTVTCLHCGPVRVTDPVEVRHVTHQLRSPFPLAGIHCPLCGEEVMDKDVALDEPDDAPLKVVCVYCTPPHVVSEGVEPASHGACPEGVKRFEAGERF